MKIHASIPRVALHTVRRIIGVATNYGGFIRNECVSTESSSKKPKSKEQRFITFQRPPEQFEKREDDIYPPREKYSL